jgi:hypothetical protein
MPSSFRSCLMSLVLFALTFAVQWASADTYQITVVDITQDSDFVGIDDSGNFVINDNNDPQKCGVNDAPCFEYFFFGQTPFFSTIAPTLNFDDGTPCAIVLDASFAPQLQANGICNNGHEIFGAFPNMFGVFDGPDISDEIFAGTFDGGLINANGDAVFIDGHDDELIFAQDLTIPTPEPSSFSLLGTGCLAIANVLGRYLQVRRNK